MNEAFRQFRFAARRLGRAPLFTAVAVVTLAVGIGANTAVFSVVDSVLLEPLPYEEPDQLVSLWHEAPGLDLAEAELSQATYFTYRLEGGSFVDVGLWDDFGVTITGLAEPERAAAIMVTDGTLPLLGATAAVGRIFGPADDAPGAPATAVVSHTWWTRRFGRDPGVVGRTLQIDGRPHEIIGVLAAGFRILDHDADVYLPSRFDPAAASFGNFSYQAIGRLRPGVTRAQAEAELGPLLLVAAERFPGPIGLDQIRQARLRPIVRPLKADLVGDVTTVLWVLLGTVGLVLLLACANVANLFLVQAELRQREVAVRTALGAGRREVALGFLAESAVLSLLGALTGLALAWGGLRMLVRLGPDSLPRIHGIGIDGGALLFTAGIAMLAAVLFGLYPAIRYGRGDLHAVIKEGGRAADAGRERHRLRNGLVVSQVALALILLTGSGLMIRSVQSLRAVDPGFARPEEVLSVRLYIPDAEVPEAAAVARLQADLLDRVAAIPGVTAAGATSSLDLAGQLSNSNPILVEGRANDPARLPPVRTYRFVLPGFHETVGTRLLAGRTLTRADVEARARVVVVNEALAREEWGSAEAAIGQRIRDFLPGTNWHEVVGVTGSIRYGGLSQPAPAAVYWPNAVEKLWEQDLMVFRSLEFVVRARGNPSALVGPLQEAVWSVNRSLPLANVRTLDRVIDESMARTAFAMVMLSIAAMVALVLGLVGIYGVISYIVAQRTREIGVRIALGARPGQVRRMVVGQAAIVAAIGVAVGLAGAVVLTRLMAGLLYGTSPLDFLTYGIVTVAIGLVALAASWLPARRAAAVDPVAALRAE